jgi:hypothetical protein
MASSFGYTLPILVMLAPNVDAPPIGLFETLPNLTYYWGFGFGYYSTNLLFSLTLLPL